MLVGGQFAWSWRLVGGPDCPIISVSWRLLDKANMGSRGPDCPSNSMSWGLLDRVNRVSGGLLDDLESCLEACFPGTGGLLDQGS